MVVKPVHLVSHSILKVRFLGHPACFCVPPIHIKSCQENQNTIHEFQHVESLPSPRFIKTHHPISMLPPDLLNKAKVSIVSSLLSCCLFPISHFGICDETQLSRAIN